MKPISWVAVDLDANPADALTMASAFTEIELAVETFTLDGAHFLVYSARSSHPSTHVDDRVETDVQSIVGGRPIFDGSNFLGGLGLCTQRC